VKSADALELVDPDRLLDSLDRELPEVLKLDEPLDQLGGVLGEVGLPRLGDLFHSRCQARGVPESRVVHPQIVADLPDHDLARVESHPHREADPLRETKLVRVTPQILLQRQRRVAGPRRVILVRDRRPEQRHDPIARVLIDCPLEAA
jgi:hypothetical protein